MNCSPELELSQVTVNSRSRGFFHVVPHGFRRARAEHSAESWRWEAVGAEGRRSVRNGKMGWMKLRWTPVHSHMVRPPILDPGRVPRGPPTRAAVSSPGGLLTEPRPSTTGCGQALRNPNMFGFR